MCGRKWKVKRQIYRKREGKDNKGMGTWKWTKKEEAMRVSEMDIKYEISTLRWRIKMLRNYYKNSRSAPKFNKSFSGPSPNHVGALFFVVFAVFKKFLLTNKPTKYKLLGCGNNFQNFFWMGTNLFG